MIFSLSEFPKKFLDTSQGARKYQAYKILLSLGSTRLAFFTL